MFCQYEDLPAAIRDVRSRIEEKDSLYTIPDDYYCLEFLEIVDESTRISFGHPVKNLGNQIEQFIVSIPKAKYDQLVRDQKWLYALEAGGVNNWEGYDLARSIAYEDPN